MDKAEKTIRDLLELADIEVNGGDAWDIRVQDERFYERVLRDVSLGLGESYMDGWWDSDSLDEFINRVLRTRLDEKIRANFRMAFQIFQTRLINMQASGKAFEVGQKHYDLGNKLYSAMLDKRMNYSCAYWKDAKNLDDAQEAKLELICKKIGIKPGMQILELGCGWGSFARYAAENYGAHVLGVTVSKEQIALGSELCKGLPVELRLQDYREIGGKFDAVISIGMLEHVGYKNYRTYMKVVDRCLKEDGIAFIHTIGSNQSLTTGEPWSDRYIFSNGMLPSISQLGAAMEGIFVMEDWQNFGPHYDTTLMAWYDNFIRAWPDLQDRYDERFKRLWIYYLLTSAGAFRSRHQQLWQIVFTRQGVPQPACRFS